MKRRHWGFFKGIIQNVADTVSFKRLISVQAILPQVHFTSTRCLAKVSVTMGNQKTSGHGWKNTTTITKTTV